MKNQNLKIRKFLFLCSIVVLFFSSCKISTKKISKDDLIKNEELILTEVYKRFFSSKEYLNGTRMNPPMQFDHIYIYCLNMNENNIDLNALKKEEIEIEWDDLTIDKKDIQELIENNIPIVQMSFHWWDPKSQSGNNKWVTKTYFFPECKSENNKLNLGKGYPMEDRIQSIKYFPYFYDNIMNVPMSGGNWLDFKSSAISQNINYNGTIYKLSDLVDKNNTKNSDISKETKPDLISDTTYTDKNNQSEIIKKPEVDNYEINEGFSGQATVIVEKAYFHDSSDELTKRKAYILKGEQISYTNRENGFIYIEYTNTNNKTTKGWIKDSDFEFN